jgi:hypothetical protein
MGKETKTNVYTNTNETEKNEINSKLNSDKKHYVKSFLNENPNDAPKKMENLEKTKKSTKVNSNHKNDNNKLNELVNQNNNIHSNLKAPRKYSSGGETSCTSEESTPKKNKAKKNNNKKTFQKPNKNKIPFKGEAKDFKIKYKTELCKYYEINGYCKYGDKCAYAHGKENLRSKVTNTTAYRTKKCQQFFEQGYCPYGNRCQFAHQLKSNIINNPYDKGMSYGKILETISKLENVENIKKLIEKPRLPVFKDICENKQNIQSRLLEDIKGLSYNNLYKRIDN